MAQPLISAAVLAQFRDMTEGMMDSTASVLPSTNMWVDTGGGSGFAKLNDTPLEFPCRLTPTRNRDDVMDASIAGKLDVTNVLKMTYPLDVESLGGLARLTIEGEPYEVVGLPPIGTYSVHRVAYVRKVIPSQSEWGV